MFKYLIKKTVVLCIFLGCIFLVDTASLFGEEKRFVNDIGMEFVLIPAGSFIMGSPPDEPFRDEGEMQHPVTITSPFYLQVTEVTLAQWWAIMGKKFFGRRKGVPDMPAIKVSWHDAEKFIKKLNRKNRGRYRLPTEAEWEYAARAGTTTAYFWGDTIDCSRAMYGNNPLKDDTCTLYYLSLKIAPGGPAPVKSFAPNPWGLYDMHGNVWEWCSDCFAEYNDDSPQVDPKIETGIMLKVRRGGSWFKNAYPLRSANRAYGHAATRFQTTGFRLVRELDSREH